jgi:dTDP-4-dehydrorhamnose reductase
MKMKKCSRNILIIGVDSQIGSSLQKTLKYNNFNVFGTTRRRERVNSTTLFFDLANPIIDFYLSQFDTVVICAAITEIQKCEQEAEECERINVKNTIQLIDKCSAQNCFIIFLSSNSVFDGCQPFYNIDAKPNPKSNYGRFKLAVELYIRKNINFSACVLRITKVITDKSHFIEQWNQECIEGKEIVVFTNRFLSPVPVNIVVNSILLLIEKQLSGLYHLGSDEEISYYDYAKQVFAKNEKALSLLKPMSDPSTKGNSIIHDSLTTHLPNR